jgi:putative membrane protein
VMWYWGSGFGWGMGLFGALMMLLFWGGVAAVIVLLVRSLSRSAPSSSDTAMETLRRRLASGEITPEEFDRVRKILQG